MDIRKYSVKFGAMFHFTRGVITGGLKHDLRNNLISKIDE